jgi:hypothetical protein
MGVGVGGGVVGVTEGATGVTTGAADEGAAVVDGGWLGADDDGGGAERFEDAAGVTEAAAMSVPDGVAEARLLGDAVAAGLCPLSTNAKPAAAPIASTTSAAPMATLESTANRGRGSVGTTAAVVARRSPQNLQKTRFASLGVPQRGQRT